MSISVNEKKCPCYENIAKTYKRIQMPSSVNNNLVIGFSSMCAVALQDVDDDDFPKCPVLCSS